MGNVLGIEETGVLEGKDNWEALRWQHPGVTLTELNGREVSAKVVSMMAEMTSLLGPYEVLRKTKTFPVPFWAVLHDEDRILIETMESVRWVEVKTLEAAIANGDVRLEVEL